MPWYAWVSFFGLPVVGLICAIALWIRRRR